MSNPIADYRLDEYIGLGGFSYVFGATDLSSGASVAVKVLKNSAPPGAAGEFDNEGVLLRRLATCEGVVDIFHSGSSTVELDHFGMKVPLDVRFHVLHRADGSLADLTSDAIARDSLAWTERLRLWRDMVLIVRQMHSFNVVHRDLKAENFLLLLHGGESRVRLADFGRSKDISIDPLHDPAAYLSGRGDRRFAPPEYLLLQGGYAAQNFVSADYYGLGSLLVELMTGQPMTAAALGDFGSIIRDEQQNILRGVRRSTRSFTEQYRIAIDDIVSAAPQVIRDDIRIILKYLCSPNPSERSLPGPFRRDRGAPLALDWVIRRIDIMTRRLRIEAKAERLRQRKIGLTA